MKVNKFVIRFDSVARKIIECSSSGKLLAAMLYAGIISVHPRGGFTQTIRQIVDI